MKIDFKTISNGKIELENGIQIDGQILEFYDHDSFANGTGWVDLPEGLINGKDVFKGTTDNKELPKMDSKGNIIITNPPAYGAPGIANQSDFGVNGNNVAGDYVGKGLTTGDSASTDGIYRITGQHNFRQAPIDQEEYISAYINQVLSSWTEPMLSKFFDKVRAELIRRNEGQYRMMWGFQVEPEYVMDRLGFKRRGDDRWYHAVLGIDSSENWLKFNPQTDNISQVVTMLFKSGWVKGQFKVRMDIKAALDIR